MNRRKYKSVFITALAAVSIMLGSGAYADDDVSGTFANPLQLVPTNPGQYMAKRVCADRKQVFYKRSLYNALVANPSGCYADTTTKHCFADMSGRRCVYWRVSWRGNECMLADVRTTDFDANQAAHRENYRQVDAFQCRKIPAPAN